MIRFAALLAAALVAAPATQAMETFEPLPGITITRGPGTDPEPKWRAARRDAFVLGTLNEPKEFRIKVRSRKDFRGYRWREFPEH
ncbi:MAG: hypothetical protein AAGG56_07330 [Pseudomonadota bacterium]